MQKLGWVENRNVRFEFRWQAAKPEPAEAAVAELLAIPCDVIVAGTIQAFLALRRSSNNIPVVFVNLPDPVATGLVSTIAKTNGNFTGFTAYEYSITGKWLEVLKEIAPKVQRVGMIFGTATAPVGENFYRSLEPKASAANIKPIPISFADTSGLEASIEAFASEPDGGFIMAAEGAAALNRAAIIKLAAKHNIPAVYPFRNIPAEGGLAFYGIDFVDIGARAPSYVDQLLHGARPTDLPIQAPTKFDLVINLKTAKALGLTVPPSLLALADEVIE
jgi:putative ABC transport system substrate-binding protein